MMSKTTILLVEDEIAPAEMLSAFLEMNDFRVLMAHDGLVAKDLLKEHGQVIKLAILDIMVPGADGRDICRFIRHTTSIAQMPVIFLTAKDQEQDEILGLSIGADDYIPKPAGLNLILAHVKSLLRRRYPESGEEIEIGNVKLNTMSLDVSAGGRKVELTAREFKLMEMLFQNPKRVYSRQEILEYISNDEKHIFDRTIDVHVKNIRLKLEEYGNVIKTYRGLGYGIDKTLM